MSESEAVVRDEFFESLLGDFLDESGQLLDRLNENLLQLDEWVRLLDDEDRLARFSTAALQTARRFDLERSADLLEEVLADRRSARRQTA